MCCWHVSLDQSHLFTKKDIYPKAKAYSLECNQMEICWLQKSPK